jgi:hypothetical protein
VLTSKIPKFNLIFSEQIIAAKFWYFLVERFALSKIFNLKKMGCCPGKSDYKPERLNAVEANRTCTDVLC